MTYSQMKKRNIINAEGPYTNEELIVAFAVAVLIEKNINSSEELYNALWDELPNTSLQIALNNFELNFDELVILSKNFE